jgi:integrase
MPSIHRHSSGRSPFWFAKFRGADGRPVVKSTKQTTRSKAMEIALNWERAADAGRRGVLTEAQCRKVLSEILERTTGETLRSNTTEEFLKSWITGKTNSKAQGTATRYNGTVNLFLDSLGTRAKLPLAAITPRHIESFRDEQIKAGKAASTVNVDLKTLRTAFNLACRQSLLLNNPVNAVEFPDEERHKRDVFTPEQITALLDACDSKAGQTQLHGAEWKTAILIGCYTGCRLGDAVSMTWENIKMDGAVKTITFIPEKTRKKGPLTIPLHPDLEAHLLTIAGDNPHAPLTPTLATMEVGGRSGLSREFKDLMSKAKVDDGRIESSNGGKGRAFSALSFHSFRHSFVSALANADVTDELRMKLSGHKSKSSHQVYTKLELNTLAKAISKLPSLNAGK